jgi:acetolactate synthase-1/3 small subunit
MEHKHTISVLVENHFGVLARVATLFAGRGFNIDSLTVGETEDQSTSRMTIVVRGDDRVLEQVTKQLNKLVDVIKVMDLSAEGFIDRELILLRVDTSSKNRAEIIEIADVFGARAVDISRSTITLELSADSEKVDNFIEMMRSHGIKELARTGKIAMGKSKVK